MFGLDGAKERERGRERGGGERGRETEREGRERWGEREAVSFEEVLFIKGFIYQGIVHLELIYQGIKKKKKKILIEKRINYRGYISNR